jgi:hypothetical protein
MVTGLAEVIGLALHALAAMHPMHASVAELVDEPAARSALVTLRVFADDFRAAVPADRDSDAEAYVRSHFELRDASGRAIPLRWEGASRSGDVIQLRFRAELRAGLAGVRVRNLILCERFADQVNIVRATSAGRTASLLFTRGDQAKALP